MPTPPSIAALDVHGLVKTFDGARALDALDLSVGAGRVHALLGGNGCGKSTLIKALAGVQPGDAGEIVLWGERHEAASFSPPAAAQAGLRFVHQDLGLVEDFTVGENFALASGYPTSYGAVRWRQLHRHCRQLLERFEVDAHPHQRVSDLRPATRTMFAIARALSSTGDDGHAVLVLDEPTASLPVHEVEVLLQSIRQRAAAGQTVILVSHKLPEVLAVSDDITVMRDGRVAATMSAAHADPHTLLELMAGQAVARQAKSAVAAPKQSSEVLAIENLGAGPLTDVSLTVRSREIVGVAGLLGTGRSSVLRAIFGDLPTTHGEIRLGGEPYSPSSPAAAIEAGIGFVPENRPSDAAFAAMSVKQNISIAVVGNYFQSLRLRSALEKADVDQLVKRLSIKTSSPEALITSLSGGNQQKAILARWIQRNPRLLLLDEPTQGVDAVARADIYRLLRDVTDAGCAVLLVSSDFEELAQLCDRVLILRGGTITAQVAQPHCDAATLIRLSYSDTLEPAL